MYETHAALISLLEVAVFFFFFFFNFSLPLFALKCIHIIPFHLHHSANIYSNWLQEQFCNLSLYMLCMLYMQ